MSLSPAESITQISASVASHTASRGAQHQIDRRALDCCAMSRVEKAMPKIRP